MRIMDINTILNNILIALQNHFMAPAGYTVCEQIGHYLMSGIGILFTVFYTYQFIYIFIALVKKPLTYPETDKTKRYGVLIAARNEEKVLPNLLKSILGQTYPSDLIDIYVVADNCTDNTADVAREYGATVYERQNKERVGKGYALEFLFNCLKRDKGLRYYDAYMIIDADNVLRANYVEEMDKAHCAGNRILTSYRNSKNYGHNWVSAGYSLWFMREARHLNNPRSILRSSAAISGTGFLIDSDIIEKNNGWKHFLLTEDIEFTIDSVLHGERVGYCHSAELFDEQPETFRQSWRQRMRWAKGFFQVFRHYGWDLIKGSVMLRWSCFDLTMNIMPAFILSMIQLVGMAVLIPLNTILTGTMSIPLLESFAQFLGFAYGMLFVLGFFTLLTEWKKIHCPKWKVIFHLFTFPLFMLTYIPISMVALFSRVEWKPIEHRHAIDTTDIDGQGAAKSAPAVPVAAPTEAPAEEKAEEKEPAGQK